MSARHVGGLALISLFLVAAMPEAQGRGSATTPAPQTYENRLEVRVTGLRKASEWKMFGDMPGMPSAKPKARDVLLIVAFEVRDLKTGKPDTDASFKDFSLEDQGGMKYDAAVATTDLREMAFSVGPAVKPRTFRIAGLAFDISGLPIAPQK